MSGKEKEIYKCDYLISLMKTIAVIDSVEFSQNKLNSKAKMNVGC